MEEVFVRFPNVGQKIFKKINDQNLVKCQKISKIWQNFIENDSLLWKRRIHKFTKNQVEFKNDWNLATKNVSIDIVKKLAINIDDFLKLFPKKLQYQHSPLHILAYLGRTSLFKILFEKTRVINPATHGWLKHER